VREKIIPHPPTLLLLAAALLLASCSHAAASQPADDPITCNLPAVEYPDGCQDMITIAPPDAPIPAPCILDFYVEPDPDPDGTLATTRLVIVVEHPEYETNPIDYVYFVRQPGTSQPAGWRHRRRGNWDAACGKDEAPLAWATSNLLAGDLGATGVYSTPLPSGFVEFLAELGGWELWRMYLPVVMRGEP